MTTIPFKSDGKVHKFFFDGIKIDIGTAPINVPQVQELLNASKNWSAATVQTVAKTAKKASGIKLKVVGKLLTIVLVIASAWLIVSLAVSYAEVSSLLAGLFLVFFFWTTTKPGENSGDVMAPNINQEPVDLEALKNQDQKSYNQYINFLHVKRKLEQRLGRKLT